MKPSAVVRKYSISGIDSYSVEMLERLKEGTKLYTAPQTKPLSDDEIGLITTDKKWSHIESPLLLEFARAIEERHGIK